MGGNKSNKNRTYRYMKVAMGLALSALLAPGANAQKQPTKAGADGRAEQLDHCKFFPKAAASHLKLAAA